MVGDVHVVGLILFFGSCLAIIFMFRLIREGRARKLLQSSGSNAKLYLAGSKKTLSDGIKVYGVNGAKTILGRDARGNYVVLRPGPNEIAAGFMSRRGFFVGLVFNPLIIHLHKKDGVVSCLAEPGGSYVLDYDPNEAVFTVQELMAHNEKRLASRGR